ncbi:hypothetical protein GCM10023191_000560 [Actinoallomurus oryzae]|uniref:Uncharacterized protein n=1 Tax=Actinoallomurus oryzae TaxID=502180 RepID=A0ABP8P772_9ACTN
MGILVVVASPFATCADTAGDQADVGREKGVREVAFYLCFVPEGRPVTVRTLIGVAGRTWPV